MGVAENGVPLIFSKMLRIDQRRIHCNAVPFNRSVSSRTSWLPGGGVVTFVVAVAPASGIRPLSADLLGRVIFRTQFEPRGIDSERNHPALYGYQALGNKDPSDIGRVRGPSRM